MIKSQLDVLKDLKALQLNGLATINNDDILQGYTLALITIATQWGVDQEFKQEVRQALHDRLLPLPVTR